MHCYREVYVGQPLWDAILTFGGRFAAVGWMGKVGGWVGRWEGGRMGGWVGRWQGGRMGG